MKNIDLKIAGIVDDSITDGPGLRFTIFAQGCPHGCKGCHNMQTHDFDIFANGNGYTILELIEKMRGNKLLDGVTFSGGEPFAQASGFAELSKEIRKNFPHFNIWCYSGYTYSQIQEDPAKAKMLKQIDVLIDGRFIEEQMSYALRFRGSMNQRVIDVRKSSLAGKIVLCEKYM